MNKITQGHHVPANRLLRDNTSLGPLKRPSSSSDTSIRNDTLWEMKRLLELRLGGDWHPFQEKAGVYGVRRRIPLYRDLALYLGIAARSSIYRFDMIAPSSRQDIESLDERRTHIYQVFVYVKGLGFGYQESKPRVIYTTATLAEAVLRLTRYVDKFRRALSRI